MDGSLRRKDNMNVPKFAAALLIPLSSFFLLSSTVRAQPERSPSQAEDPGELVALNAAINDLCRRDVVMLGENGYHGDGRTVAFKAALIRILVRRCRFNAVFFEASHYDFIEISRRLRVGEPVSADMVSSSIGQIWNRDEELSPLIPFLLTE